MGRRNDNMCWKFGLIVLVWMQTSSAILSPMGVNYEVVALMAIKNDLNDPNNVLGSWNSDAVDPCSWEMVTCSAQEYVVLLGFPMQHLSGTLSPWIGNLSNLQSVLFQNNAISGPIPAEIQKLVNLRTLDLSNNMFSGAIPYSVGNLKNLNYLRLNNNSLSGPCPESLSNIKRLIFVDISYNNLSGPLPKISAGTFKISGNQLLCESRLKNNCSAVFGEPLSYYPSDALPGKTQGGTRKTRLALVLGSTLGSVCAIVSVGLLLWVRYRRNQRVLSHVNDKVP